MTLDVLKQVSEAHVRRAFEDIILRCDYPEGYDRDWHRVIRGIASDALALLTAEQAKATPDWNGTQRPDGTWAADDKAPPDRERPAERLDAHASRLNADNEHPGYLVLDLLEAASLLRLPAAGECEEMRRALARYMVPEYEHLGYAEVGADRPRRYFECAACRQWGATRDAIEHVAPCVLKGAGR